MSIQTQVFRQVFAIAGLLLFIAGCDSEPVSLQRLSDNAVILAVGDSLTSGYGASPDQSYPSILASLSGRTVINAGISGEVSANGLRRLPALLKQHKPELLILCHGGNDILRKRSMTEMRQNIMSMIRLAQQDAIPVVLLGVPKPGLFLSSYEAYQSIADETGVLYIDELIPDVLSDNDLKSDAVHPNSRGYAKMAQTIYQFLQDRGAL